MAIHVEIDSGSGFCGGVIRAVGKAEKYLSGEGKRQLFSIGSIVHNEAELFRLHAAGLITVNAEDLSGLEPGSDVLIRAHGEPPATYKKAGELGLNIIDCTCPVVLRLQKSIREAYQRTNPAGGQIVIFGKVGHAEVLGLLGQVDNDALVLDDMKMLSDAIETDRICLSGPLEIFSQTTRNPAEYAAICSAIEEAMAHSHELPVSIFKGTGLLTVHDTICRQVSGRYGKLSDFAMKHDVIIFVSGKDSSNGKVLCNLCRSMNIRTYHVADEEGVRPEWFREDDNVGICGATSTPKWLLDAVAKHIEALYD